MITGDALVQILRDKTCIVGMGNIFRNDDAVGVLVAERLLEGGALPDNLSVMNVEDVIESYIFPIAEGPYKNILLVDAVKCHGVETGSLIVGRLGDFEELGAGFSTHKLSLSAGAKIFEQHGKETYLLGIAADNIEFGSAVCREVMDCADKVVDLIRSVRS